MGGWMCGGGVGSKVGAQITWIFWICLVLCFSQTLTCRASSVDLCELLLLHVTY